MSHEESDLPSFLKMLSSYNSNVLLAALVFLLLVVLFVLLLHLYARFFWSSHSERRRRRTVTTTRIIPPLPLGDSSGRVSTAARDDKGLDSSVLLSIPLFVYEDKEKEEECVICLGLWEEGDIGRKLRKCKHGFHVECIDMWFSSHSTCPICRSPIDRVEEEQEQEVRLQLFPEGEEENVADDRRYSLSFAEMEENRKTEVDEGEGGERIEEETNGGGGLRSSNRRSTSASSSSLMRMLSSRSRSECNKVFPSATQDPSSSS